MTFIFLHGYGMNFKKIVDKIDGLIPVDYNLVIPEALSRYYTKGSSGDVGSSWMTREERDDDIIDNVLFLDQVIEDLHGSGRIPNDSRKVVCGFSQGGPTAARWACMGTMNVDELVLWGSDFPEDVLKEPYFNKLCQLKVKFVLGDNDEYLSQDIIISNNSKLVNLAIPSTYRIYGGSHRISDIGITEVLSSAL